MWKTERTVIIELVHRLQWATSKSFSYQSPWSDTKAWSKPFVYILDILGLHLYSQSTIIKKAVAFLSQFSNVCSSE